VRQLGSAFLAIAINRRYLYYKKYLQKRLILANRLAKRTLSIRTTVDQFDHGLRPQLWLDFEEDRQNEFSG